MNPHSKLVVLENRRRVGLQDRKSRLPTDLSFRELAPGAARPADTGCSGCEIPSNIASDLWPVQESLGT